VCISVCISVQCTHSVEQKQYCGQSGALKGRMPPFPPFLPWLSVRFHLNPEDSNSHGFELHRPAIKVKIAFIITCKEIMQ